MTAFDLDPRLLRDSSLVATLDLCQIRLSHDGRWPWILLVPERPNVSEIFDLTPADQAVLALETNKVATVLKNATGATKINVAAIGNIVRQLHVHVIARNEGDANWPGPVWGFEQPIAWDEDERRILTTRILEAL